MANTGVHKRQDDIAQIRQDIAEIKGLLMQLLHPALSLSVKEKAAAINRARGTGDGRGVREAIREISGE
mgnify:CR=1 FL=1